MKMDDSQREKQIQIILARGYRRIRPPEILRICGRALWRDMALLLLLQGISAAAIFALFSLLQYVTPLESRRLLLLGAPLFFLSSVALFAFQTRMDGLLEIRMSCKYTLLHIAAVCMLFFAALCLLALGIAAHWLFASDSLRIFLEAACCLLFFASAALRLMRVLGMYRGIALAASVWAVAGMMALLLPEAALPLYAGIPLIVVLGLLFIRETLLFMDASRKGGREICY